MDAHSEPLPTIVYVASARSDEIAAFLFRADAARLEVVQRISIPAGVTPLAVDPRRRYLYAGLRGESPSAIAFAIDPSNGHLSPIGTASLSDPPMYLATDAAGRFLFSASYTAGTFSINAIRDSGEITSTPIGLTRTPPHPHSIVADRTNRYLLVASLGGDAILQYRFDPETGQTIPNAEPFVKTAAGSGPRHMVFAPTGDVLYVNGEFDGSISSFAFSPQTGRLRALHRAPMLPETSEAAPWAGELAIRPDGRFLYATERRTSTLAIFDLSGEPGSLLRRDSVVTEEQPRSFALDAQGRFLIVAGERSHHITVYGIDPSTGALEPRNRYAVGEKPVWVTCIGLPAPS